MTEIRLTRRSLLASGVAAATCAVPIAAANAKSIARLNEIKWHRTCDVLVIGFGGSGGPAAAAAKEAGADVLVLEKMPVGGGNATVSSGGFMIPDNPEDGYTYLRQTYQFSGDECDEELLRLFCKESQTIKPWIAKLDPKAKFLVYGHAGWQNLPGADAIKKWCIKGRDGYTGGDMLFQTFRHIVEDVQKTPVLYETPATRLIRQGDKVVGIVAKQKGRTINIRAKRGVIIASGGFQCNKELIKTYVSGADIEYLGTPANTGDGLLMAQSVGAKLWHMTAVSAPLGIKVPGISAAFQLSARVPSFIWVDQDGARFVNEKGIDGHTQITAVNIYDSVKHRYPRIPCYMIFDDPACQAGPIYGSARSGYALNREHYKWSQDNSEEIKKGVIIKAATLEELAEKLKMPKLVATVKKWNEDILAGGDTVFGRRVMKDPNAKVVFAGRDTDLLSAPLKLDGPVYAVPLVPVAYNCQGGPKKSPKCEVLDAFGNPIPHLYICGELGSMWTSVYQGASSNCECMIFGRIAGREAAKNKA